MITGYERPDAGEVYLGTRRITDCAAAAGVRRGIGRTFQLTRIFPRLTVLENMLVAAHSSAGTGRPLADSQSAGRAGGAADRQRAMELLEFTGIAGHAGALAGTLSYGQRKLLELSYVLVAEPAVVLLDEPAGGVNPSLIDQIADRIRELNAAGTTFLIVEHNMDFVMGLCDPSRCWTTAPSSRPGRRRSSGRTRACWTPTWARRRTTRTASRPADAVLVVAGLTVAGYGGGTCCTACLQRARGRHHLRRGAERRRQVDAAGRDQRPAAAAARARPAPRRADHRQEPAAGAAGWASCTCRRTTACSAR